MKKETEKKPWYSHILKGKYDWGVFLKEHIHIENNFYKKRPMPQVYKRYEEARALRHRFFDTVWKDWFLEAEKVGAFWGKHNGEKEIHEVENHPLDSYGPSHSSHIVENKHLPLICPMSDIPLLIYNSNQEVSQAAKDVLAGKVKRPVRCDALVKRYHAMEARLEHMRYVINLYQAFIDKYLSETYPDRYKWIDDSLVVATVPATGETYHYMFIRGRGFLEVTEIKHLEVK